MQKLEEVKEKKKFVKFETTKWLFTKTSYDNLTIVIFTAKG